MDPLDGEPDLETHPDIEKVTTTLIAVLTRSGTQTQEDETCEMDEIQEPLSPQIPCGQATQLVDDIPTESDEEREIAEGTLEDNEEEDTGEPR